MTLPGRRLNKYYPRRSRKTVKEQKSKLLELEQKISIEVGTLLNVMKNGQAEKVQQVSLKLRDELLKVGSEMSKLAQEMQGPFPKAVHEFLVNIDTMTKSPAGLVEEDKIQRCFSSQEKLESLSKIRE